MRSIAVLAASLFCAVAQADDVRTWTDTTGRTMQAQFIREVDGDVTFLKDGKLFTFALEKLSEKDQKLIRELEGEKKVEEKAPPAGAPRREAAAERGNTQSKEDGDKAGTSESGKPALTSKRPTADNRTWRDRFGKQTSGRFVRVHDGNVILSRSGRLVPVPFADLSRGDQEYVREFLTARGEGHLVPAAKGAGENATGLAAADAAPGEAITPAGPPMPGPAMGGGGGGGGFPPGGVGGNLANNSAAEAMERMQERNRQQMEQARERSRQQAEEMQARNQQRTEEMQKRNEESAQRLAALQSLHRPSAPPVPAVPVANVSTPRTRRLTDPQQIVGFIVGLPIMAAVGSLLTALVLRAAAYFVAGDHMGYGEAYGTMFLSYIANGVIGFVLALIIQTMTDSSDGMNPLQFLALPVAFLVQSGITSARHDTGFGKACAFTFVTWLIWIAIIILIAVFVVIAFGTARHA